MSTLKFVIIDKKTRQKSKPVKIDWFLFGDDDLEFENGDTLPLNDFKFFRKDFTIKLNNNTNNQKSKQ